MSFMRTILDTQFDWSRYIRQMKDIHFIYCEWVWLARLWQLHFRGKYLSTAFNTLRLENNKADLL